ncbi:MAG: GTPase, partial [Actinomycetota bacterium]|nr:GTPase [Actinomycetota bacterium]
MTVDPGRLQTDALVDRARGGDRVAIAKLISLVESGGASARAVVAATAPHAGRAWTVGITGAPGAGKSTLTDGLVRHLRT